MLGLAQHECYPNGAPLNRRIEFNEQVAGVIQQDHEGEVVPQVPGDEETAADEYPGQVPHGAVTLVVAVRLAGQQAVQGMAEVIVPVDVQPQAAQFRAADEACVIEVAFRHQVNPAVQRLGPGVHRLGQPARKWLGRLVGDAVHRFPTGAVAPASRLCLGKVGPAHHYPRLAAGTEARFTILFMLYGKAKGP